MRGLSPSLQFMWIVVYVGISRLAPVACDSYKLITQTSNATQDPAKMLPSRFLFEVSPPFSAIEATCNHITNPFIRTNEKANSTTHAPIHKRYVCPTTKDLPLSVQEWGKLSTIFARVFYQQPSHIIHNIDFGNIPCPSTKCVRSTCFQAARLAQSVERRTLT